jgi:hypothetical protein
MSNPRPWIVKTLQEAARHDGKLNGLLFEHVGSHGLRVVRRGRPDALIYCAGVDGDEIFGPKDL